MCDTKQHEEEHHHRSLLDDARQCRTLTPEVSLGFTSIFAFMSLFAGIYLCLFVILDVTIGHIPGDVRMTIIESGLAMVLFFALWRAMVHCTPRIQVAEQIDSV